MQLQKLLIPCKTGILKNLTGLNSQEVNQMLLNWYAVQGTFYFMQVKLPLCTFHNGAGKLLTCSKEHDCNWSVEPPPRSHTDRDQTNQESYENDGSTTQQQSKSSYLPVYRKKRERKKKIITIQLQQNKPIGSAETTEYEEHRACIKVWVNIQLHFFFWISFC